MLQYDVLGDINMRHLSSAVQEALQLYAIYLWNNKYDQTKNVYNTSSKKNNVLFCYNA